MAAGLAKRRSYQRLTNTQAGLLTVMTVHFDLNVDPAAAHLLLSRVVAVAQTDAGRGRAFLIIIPRAPSSRIVSAAGCDVDDEEHRCGAADSSRAVDGPRFVVVAGH